MPIYLIIFYSFNKVTYANFCPQPPRTIKFCCMHRTLLNKFIYNINFKKIFSTYVIEINRVHPDCNVKEIRNFSIHDKIWFQFFSNHAQSMVSKTSGSIIDQCLVRRENELNCCRNIIMFMHKPTPGVTNIPSGQSFITSLKKRNLLGYIIFHIRIEKTCYIFLRTNNFLCNMSRSSS